MKRFTRMAYKLLISLMITITLSFFVVTSYSHANKFQDLLTEDGFYYTGAQEGTATYKAGFFEQVINALSEIASYLLGMIGLAFRGIGIGWIEIAEMILTSILDTEAGFFDVIGSSMDNYSQNIVNVQTIIFNKVELLNANIFEEIDTDTTDREREIDADTTLTEEQKKEEKKKLKASSVKIPKQIRKAVAKWYYVLRLLSIAFMLVLLIFLGIKMALAVPAEKANCKQMIVDWVVGMILVFSIHYIMLAIFSVNDSVVAALEPLVTQKQALPEEYTYGLESKLTSDEMETTLYESARTRAYSLSFVDGFTGMVIYGVLVYFAWRFAIMYIFRVFNVMILTLVAPAIAASYALNKVVTGKSKVFSGWLKEYIMTVIIQIFHVIIYASFVSMALKLAMESLPGIILAFVILNFMLKADKLLRSLFKLAGGEGSLSGDMEKIGFQELKQAPKNIGALMVGGDLGKNAVKLTYRVATKPVRASAEAAFTKVMMNKANKDEEETIAEENKKAELEKRQEEAEENVKETQRKQEELKARQEEIENERAYYAHMQDEENMRKKHRELLENQESQEKLKKKMKQYQEDLEIANENLEYFEDDKKMRELQKVFETGTFTGNIKDLLFDPNNYVEKRESYHIKPKFDRNGKANHFYKDGKYHKRKTIREGDANWAIWRKKKFSVGKQFASNMKIASLFGISDASKKELKKEFEFWKDSVLGVATAMIGWPAMVMNPILGMTLLGNSAAAGLNFATRVRTVKNRPSYKKDKDYKFSAFSSGAQANMALEAEREIFEAQSKITQKIGKKHPELAEKIINGESITYNMYSGAKKRFKRWLNRPSGISTIQQEEMLRISQTEFRKKFKDELKELNGIQSQMIIGEYRTKMREEERKEKESIKKMNSKDLTLKEAKVNDYRVQVGEQLFEVEVQDDFNKKQEEFVEEVQKIDAEKHTPRTEKIRKIKIEIKKKKDDLIENQITKYFAKQGVVDIRNTSMEDKDVVQIKENIIGVLEDKGIIKKGEIKLEDNLVSSENVKNVFIHLVQDVNKTNEILEQKLATNSCLEYMQENGIQDARILQTEEAKEGIYDKIKDTMMSEDSKKSAEVIRRISGGQDRVREQIHLSDFMKQIVETNVDNIKEVNVLQNSQDREILEEREINRRMNETKSRLEEAICADSSENVENQKQLEMLFLLSKLGEKNLEAGQLYNKKNKLTKDQRKKLENYQSKQRILMNDGSVRFNEDRDGSQRVVDEIKLKALEKRLYGPTQNILDLINENRPIYENKNEDIA